MRTKDMYDGKGSYIHGDEIRGLNINLINAEIESNGHTSRVELVELMKSSQKEVQTYREDNEILIRDQENHNQINFQLIHSLNNLQRKINKESSIRHVPSVWNTKERH
jgi:hypothetical protein